MDPLICLFRALANVTRLRVLMVVSRRPGATVGDVVEEVASTEPVVSKHLSLLASLGLVDTAPSGRVVHVRLASRGRCSEVSAKVLSILTSAWGSGPKANSTLSNVWNWVVADGEELPPSWEAVFERMAFVFTAYTHLRRLLILRHLARNGPVRQDALAEAIGMSPPAASRQLSKLRRRGLVERAGDGGNGAWRLVPRPQSRFQARVHRAVVDALLAMGEK